MATLLDPPAIPVRRAHDGLELPAIGFGTYKVNGFAGVEAIKSAIEVGYRLIDSAFNYENEGVVGKAIPANPTCHAKRSSSPRGCPDATTSTTRRARPSRNR